MDKDTQKRVNNNNRKRGAHFEKRVADRLGMYVVPYSGSNARFGWNDIRDSEDQKYTRWSGECKNMTLGDDNTFVIRQEWITKLIERSRYFYFLAFMEKGKADTYVLVTDGIWDKMVGLCPGLPKPIVVHGVVELPTKHNTVNIRIGRSQLSWMKLGDVMGVKNGNSDGVYRIMRLDTFKVMYDEIRSYRGEPQCSE